MPSAQNREGTPVDPVPAIVVIVTTFLVLFAWGPIYFLALGVSLSFGFVVLIAVFVVLAGATYHQLIWTADPARRNEVPVTYRIDRLRYSVAILIALVVLLALPFVR